MVFVNRLRERTVKIIRKVKQFITQKITNYRSLSTVKTVIVSPVIVKSVNVQPVIVKSWLSREISPYTHQPSSSVPLNPSDLPEQERIAVHSLIHKGARICSVKTLCVIHEVNY